MTCFQYRVPFLGLIRRTRRAFTFKIKSTVPAFVYATSSSR
jgi:hypothetical protein